MTLDFKGPVDIQFRKFEEQWLDIPVFRIFTEVAFRNPNKIALKSGSNQLTYREAYHWACRIAHTIKASNTSLEPVGIALPNDVMFPVAMLAALAVGCPYVPLDIDLAEARNQLIIGQSGLKCIITSSELAEIYEEFNPISIDKLQITDNEAFETSASADNIAYIIYTSGSTGIPKGVFQNQRNLLHDVMQYTNSIHLNETDRLTLLYSPSVNGAIRDIYGALLNGATLIIQNLKKGGLYNLSEFIREEAITVYHSIPNIFRTFLKLNTAKADFSTVRLIYLAGDRIYNSDVDLYKAFFPAHCLLYVGIGATEIATIYRQWFINHSTSITQELIPLGYAVDDRVMQLVDDNDNPVPDGEPGEIIVSSRFISLGYWRNSDQTHLSFHANPDNPAMRTYKTGDLGRINEDGLLEFIGRKDNQVKINGYRVELGEIEGALMKHPDIERCGVVLYTQNQHNVLYAFFISKTSLSETTIKDWLITQLPHYMIPQKCIQVDEIPLLHNFKNDSKAMRVLAGQYSETETIAASPSEGESPFLYTTLRHTWSKFLDEHSFNNNITWKNAGGDSVNAVNFLVQLESDLGTNLPTDWIHGEMQPLEIYRILQGLNIQEKSKKEHIFYIFPALAGISENTRAFLKNLSEYTTLRVINYPDFSSFAAKDRNWEYANAQMIQQITGYNSPNVGFIGICTGALIMNQLIALKPIKHYSSISIIEGFQAYRQQPIYVNFSDRIIQFFKRGDLFDNIIRFFYTRSESFKKLIIYLEEKRFLKFELENLLWPLYYQLRPAYFNGEVLYFGCENSRLNKNGDHWKPYFQKVNPVLLYGIHEDMLSDRNREIVQNKLLEVLCFPIKLENK